MKFMLLRPKALRPIFLLVSLLLAPSLYAQSVRTTISADSLQAGDLFQYSIVLQLDQEYQRVVFPDTADFPSDLEISGQQLFRLSNFADSISYQLQYFAVEDLIIPPLPVQLISESDTTLLFTEPVPLSFSSVLPADTSNARTEPIKPIFEFPRPLWPWLLVASLLAAFLIWWFLFRDSEEEEEISEVQETPVFHNPLHELEDELQTLRKETKVAETKDFKQFYSRVSDAIRRYYEDLYQIPALESTTRELLRYLDAYGVDHELIDYTRKVLNRADMVKFAKFTPTLDDAWKTYDFAIDFKDRAQQVDSARISRMRREFDQKYMQKTEGINPQNQGEQ